MEIGLQHMSFDSKTFLHANTAFKQLTAERSNEILAAIVCMPIH